MGNKTVRRICFDGMLVAMFFVLAKVTLKIPPNIHLAFSGITVIFATLYFGLGDGLIVAALGEGLIQLTSSYGITPTTPLWIIPPVVRALILGAFVLPLKKKGEHLEKHLVLYSIAIALSTLVVTGLNAAVEWLDGIIMGYSTAYLAAVIGWRFLSSALAGAVMGSVAVPLLKAIRAVRPDEDKRYQESTENVEALKENLEADADKD